MNKQEMSRVYQDAMARIAADHDWQCALFWYFVSTVLVILLGASFIAGRIYQMRSDRNQRHRTGVYAPDWVAPK